MLTNLDFLVIAFMALAALSLLSLCLLFLVRNSKIKKVCFYIVVALGVYAAYVGIRIGMLLFPVQLAVGIAAGAGSIAALVLERVSRGDEKKFAIARILAALALIVGIINAVL